MALSIAFESLELLFKSLEFRWISRFSQLVLFVCLLPRTDLHFAVRLVEILLPKRLPFKQRRQCLRERVSR